MDETFHTQVLKKTRNFITEYKLLSEKKQTLYDDTE